MKKTIIIAVAVAVVFGAGGFFGGIKYQQSKAPVRGAFGGGAGGAGAAGRRAGGMGFLNGQVLNSGNGTMTVKLMNGGSQVVVLAPSTQYRKAVDGTAADVTVGSNVTITGSTNPDGSLTAQSIQIRTGTSTPAGFPGR